MTGDVYGHAHMFVQRVSVIHLLNARFKEQIGDVLGARAALLQCDAESDPQFVKNVILKANMEKRMVCNKIFHHLQKNITRICLLD